MKEETTYCDQEKAKAFLLLWLEVNLGKKVSEISFWIKKS